MSKRSVAEQVAEELAPYLGPFNAKVAVKTFAGRAFENLPPERLTLDHLPGLLEALRPMLNTLAGRAATDAVLARIQREVT
jgi:hypothetical protein